MGHLRSPSSPLPNTPLADRGPPQIGSVAPVTLPARPPARVRSASVGALALGLSLLAAACGGAKPVAPPPAPAAPAEALIMVEPAPDLSEVAEPPDLVGILRIRNPQALAASVESWVGIPFDPRMLIERLDSSLLPAALALDAPVDVVVALDPSKQGFHVAPLVVLSLPVRSFDDARQSAESSGRLHQIRPGVFRLKTGRGTTCVLAAAFGTPSGRLVCGDEQADLDALLDYTVRTLPRRDFGPADIHGEVRLTPLERRFGALSRQSLSLGGAMLVQQMATGDASLDRAMMMASDAIAGEVGNLFQDFDALALDTTMADDRATLRLRLKLRGAQSWTVQVLEQASRPPTPPPALAFALPTDAAVAEFVQPIGSDRFDGVRRTLGMLLNGWMAHERVSSRDRAAVVDLFDKPFMGEGPAVVAAGPHGSAASSAPASWSLVGLGVPPQQPMTTMKKLLGVWNRPGIQAWLKGILPRSGETSGTVGPWRVATAPPALPKGSVAYTSSWVPPVPARTTDPVVSGPNRGRGAGKGQKPPPSKTKSEPPPRPVPMYLVLVPTSGVTWIGSGTDRESVLIHIKTALAGQAGTTGKSGFEPLRATPALFGGYVSVRGLLEGIASSSQSTNGRLRAAADSLDTLPHRAQDHILFVEQPIDAETKTLDFQLSIPKGAVEDLAAAAIRGASAPSHFLGPRDAP